MATSARETLAFEYWARTQDWKPHVFLSADVVLALREVDVIPCGAGHFLVAVSGAEKKLVADLHCATY